MLREFINALYLSSLLELDTLRLEVQRMEGGILIKEVERKRTKTRREKRKK
jgi:hypothetical protein